LGYLPGEITPCVEALLDLTGFILIFKYDG
jgi:hypothetical protein